MNSKLLIIVATICTLCSCSTAPRMEKKMISRLNAQEFNAASGYIYAEDQPAFSFFIEEVLPCCENAYFSIEDMETLGSGDNKVLFVTFKIRNYNQAIINYFESIGKNITKDGILRESIKIIKTNDGNKLAFNWGIPGVSNENLKWATLPSDATVESMNVRSQPNKKSEIIASLPRGQKMMIDWSSSHDGWVHAFWINSGYCYHGYIYQEKLNISNVKTYSPSIFDSFILLLVVTIIGILFIVFLLPIIFEMGGCAGWFISIAIVLGILYVFYEFIEKLLFEIFIINLPH